MTPVRAPYTVGDPIPGVCDAHDLAWVFGRSIFTIYRWSHEGRLRSLELKRPLGSKRWSGARVKEAIDSEGGRFGLLRKSA